MSNDNAMYIWGQDRNNKYARAHCYEAKSFSDIIGPLCIYGWNRSDGEGISIFRNVVTGEYCKTCVRRMREGAHAVEPSPHKTRWI